MITTPKKKSWNKNLQLSIKRAKSWNTVKCVPLIIGWKSHVSCGSGRLGGYTVSAGSKNNSKLGCSNRLKVRQPQALKLQKYRAVKLELICNIYLSLFLKYNIKSHNYSVKWTFLFPKHWLTIMLQCILPGIPGSLNYLQQEQLPCLYQTKANIQDYVLAAWRAILVFHQLLYCLCFKTF